MRAIFCLMLLLAGELTAASWKVEKDGFLAEGSVSAQKLRSDETLSVTLTLHYPKEHEPDLTLLRQNLLRNFGFGPRAFLFREELLTKGDGQATVEYRLDPQLPGTFALSFYNIAFKDTDTTLFSELMEIEVTPSLPQPDFQLIYAPVLPLENRFWVRLPPDERP